MFWKIFVPLTIMAFLFGFPVAEFTVHGLDASLWPNTIQPPSVWFTAMRNSWGLDSLLAYRDMAFGQTKALGPYGRTALAWIVAGPLLAFVACFVPNYGPRRDPRGTYGNARWASRKERARMRIGLELGLDPDTRRPIRVSTESSLITVAPPRTGKTSGLLIPNLAVPDNKGWCGPAVVIDPKGEAYRAVAARRRALGRTVHCLDPINIVGGTDTWNPLAEVDSKDILHLQRIARSLLPEQAQGEAVYFQNRAVDVIVGAFLVADDIKRPTPKCAAWLLSNLPHFENALAPLKGVAAAAAKAVLAMEPKGRDSILSTAAQAFSWCADERLQRLTDESSFSMSDVTSGNVDLFVTLPAEDMETLTPLTRWLLCELFTAVRRRRAREPIVCFIDEAATLGRFKELLIAAGELPGQNLRLWTFWQSRSQIIDVYGAEGARTLLNTAEFTTYSDLPLTDPDEREFLSRSIGDFTLMDMVETTDEKTGNISRAFQPKAVRLMTEDGVGQVPTTDVIVFPNSKRYAKRPMILRKTAHNDSRLTNLIVSEQR
ncbi:type IV secretory system conjugative DNA transfer family protein [Bradyrhizobium sp. CCH5-F6]|jgi:type IV secretion system protein VirD4|uniref:type IV secretory system conjugative DNA transfer family protein n=1 Tax=Bradyrhizobium sp. CCH5-F6 TaxID=1768753 RepID=UPI000769D868|nr:type IV secretory system conjugative DNA transfer family protein [Bradyrhizobium sp. CCH5-F6]